MKTPHTEIKITYYQEADHPASRIVEYYYRDGAFEVQEQITSWSRECAVDFWKKMNEAKHD